MDQQVISIPVKDLRPSPLQYRVRRGDSKKFDELVASVKEKGVLEPVMVRAVKGKPGFELIFGHRRLEAAKVVELEELLAVRRDVSDVEVRELQLVEHLREDPHPIDEADALGELVKNGRSVAEVASKIGRPISYVVQRLKLCGLSKASRKALDDEEISLGVALELAKMPTEKLQAEALEVVRVYPEHGDGPIPIAEARRAIEREVMRKLANAPFDTMDGLLVPKAGPCTTCPKRTGTQAELFPDASSPDLCTDPTCFREKQDALWKLRTKEAKSTGQEVLDGKKAEDALRYGGSYRKLEDNVYLPSGKSKTVRQLLGKDLPPVTLARTTDGEIFEVVKSGEVEKALREKEPKAARSRGESDYAAKQKREAAKQKLRRAAINKAIALAIEKAPRLKPMAVLELVVRAFAARVWNETQVQILAARGIEPKPTAEGAIVKLAKTCAEVDGDILGLGLELALRSGLPWSGTMVDTVSSTWRDGLKLAGIVFATLEKQVAEEARTKKKPAPAAAAKPAKGKPAKKTARRK